MSKCLVDSLSLATTLCLIVAQQRVLTQGNKFGEITKCGLQTSFVATGTTGSLEHTVQNSFRTELESFDFSKLNFGFVCFLVDFILDISKQSRFTLFVFTDFFLPMPGVFVNRVPPAEINLCVPAFLVRKFTALNQLTSSMCMFLNSRITFCSGDWKSPCLNCSSFLSSPHHQLHCARKGPSSCNSLNLMYSCLVALTISLAIASSWIRSGLFPCSSQLSWYGIVASRGLHAVLLPDPQTVRRAPSTCATPVTKPRPSLSTFLC